jgi:radical SAM superfamily enzyme
MSEQALIRTHEYGIRTGAHYIFGLPGESYESLLATARIISQLPIDTVKFHQLQIVKGTAMEKEYRKDPSRFCIIGLEDYIDFIIRFIEQLNPSIVIERFTSEMPPRFIEGNNLGLIRYDEVLRKIEQELEKRDTWQGKKFVAQV